MCFSYPWPATPNSIQHWKRTNIFLGEFGCAHWSCELWTPSDTRECFHPDLVGDPFDDHPDFSLSFFSGIVNFFLARDLFLEAEGDDDRRHSHSSSWTQMALPDLRSPPRSQTDQVDHPTPNTTISLLWFQILSGVSSKTFLIALQETDPWRTHSNIWHPKNILERQVCRLIIFFQGSPRHSADHCWGLVVQGTTTSPTELRTGFQGHIAEPPKLLLPATWSTPTQGHRRTTHWPLP